MFVCVCVHVGTKTSLKFVRTAHHIFKYIYCASSFITAVLVMGDGGGSKKYGPWVSLGAGCISGGIEAVR